MRGSSREILEEGDLRIEFGDFPRFFQLLTNFAHPYRSETIRNGFPVKFRIDMGRKDFKNHFFQQKFMKNRRKSPKSTPRPRIPSPATYYEEPRCKIVTLRFGQTLKCDSEHGELYFHPNHPRFVLKVSLGYVWVGKNTEIELLRE